MLRTGRRATSPDKNPQWHTISNVYFSSSAKPQGQCERCSSRHAAVWRKKTGEKKKGNNLKHVKIKPHILSSNPCQGNNCPACKQNTAESRKGTKHNKLFLSFETLNSEHRNDSRLLSHRARFLQREQKLKGGQLWHSAQEAAGRSRVRAEAQGETAESDPIWRRCQALTGSD